MEFLHDVLPQIGRETCPIVRGHHGGHPEEGQPLMEEGCGGSLRGRVLQGNAAQESTRPSDGGENILISVAFWQWSYYVDHDMTKPAVRHLENTCIY